MRCIIVEDEPLGQKLVAGFLKTHFPQIQVQAIIDHASDAIAWFEKYETDLVFIDNHLKGGLATDVIGSIPEERRPLFIFITAHAEYAIQALNHGAFYYLLKPLEEVDFIAAVEKALKILPAPIEMTGEEPWHEMPFKPADIVYVESSGPYSTFFLADLSQRVYSRNLGYYQSWLPSDQFVRIHHSYLVNLFFVRHLSKAPKPQVYVRQFEKYLPVSQRKAAAFYQHYKAFIESI